MRACTGARALPNQRVRDAEKGSTWLLTEIEFGRIFWRENFVATPSGHWPESLLDELPVLSSSAGLIIRVRSRLPTIIQFFVVTRYEADDDRTVESIPASHKVVVTMEILQRRCQSVGTGPVDVIRGGCVQVIVSSGIALGD